MKKIIVLVFFIVLLNIEVFGKDYVRDAKDKARISQIVAETMKDKNYLTQKIYAEFWSILDAHSNISDKELKRLRLLMTGSTIDYLFYFYQDMLIAIDQKRVYKSQDRENLEKFLLNEGILYDWRIKQNEEYIKKAISGKAVKTNHGDVYFTKDVIYGALKNLETVDKRINRLFTKSHEKHLNLIMKYIQNNNLKEFKKLLFSLSDKEFFELNIDYRKLPKPLSNIYMDRFGDVEID